MVRVAIMTITMDTAMEVTVTATVDTVTATVDMVIATVVTVTATADKKKRISLPKSESVAGKDCTVSGTTTTRRRALAACCLPFGFRFV